MSRAGEIPIVVVLAAALTLTFASCSTSFTYGTQPKVAELAKLQRGVSTPDDVRRTLGDPRGKGAVRLSIGSADLWFYDYGEGDSSGSRVKYLMVFMRENAYDGYLWFDAETTLRARE